MLCIYRTLLQSKVLKLLIFLFQEQYFYFLDKQLLTIDQFNRQIRRMSNKKYRTIDPMILQTLNLNQGRMNHILDILHGRPSKKKQQITRLKIKKDFFQNSLRQDYKSANESIVLPQISRRNQTIETQKIREKINKNFSTINRSKVRKANSLQRNQMHSNSLIKNQQQSFNDQNIKADKNFKRGLSERRKAIDQQATPVSFMNFSKEQKTKQFGKKALNNQQSRNSLSVVGSKLISNRSSPIQSSSTKQLSPSKQKQAQNLLEKSLLPSPSIKNQIGFTINYRQKTKQMINDYMGEYTVKKSKSMQVLNSKDIYRLEIQNIVAQLIPIEKLQDAEKKMKRIKKRHQHLKHFDQKFYSKLNQMDLISL